MYTAQNNTSIVHHKLGTIKGGAWEGHISCKGLIFSSLTVLVAPSPPVLAPSPPVLAPSPPPPVLGFRSLPRSLARGPPSGRLPGQADRQADRASLYFTRPRPGRKAAKPRLSLAEPPRQQAFLAQPQPCLASLEAGRALSPPPRPAVGGAPPGSGPGQPGVA